MIWNGPGVSPMSAPSGEIFRLRGRKQPKVWRTEVRYENLSVVQFVDLNPGIVIGDVIECGNGTKLTITNLSYSGVTYQRNGTEQRRVPQDVHRRIHARIYKNQEQIDC
jgi:hypothetical protein